MCRCAVHMQTHHNASTSLPLAQLLLTTNSTLLPVCLLTTMLSTQTTISDPAAAAASPRLQPAATTCIHRDKHSNTCHYSHCTAFNHLTIQPPFHLEDCVQKALSGRCKQTTHPCCFTTVPTAGSRPSRPLPRCTQALKTSL